MTSHLNRLGELTTYAYDKANQLVQRILGNENTYNYSYDLDGNLVSLSDNDSKLSYQYDALDRVVRVMTEDAVKQPDSSLIYTYDNNSNKTGLTYGLSLDSNLYNAFGTFYTYDEENQLTSLSSAGGNFNFEYDDLSRMTWKNQKLHLRQ